MTPEEYKRAQAQLSRYGHSFDVNVDRHLPADLVRTKKGAIAKRQPKFQVRNKTYYQAQCSFRGLKTKGTTEELQQLLKSRDRAKDEGIRKEMDEIEEKIDDHHEEEEAREKERWWSDPVRSFDEKVEFDAFRAVKESLETEELLKNGCHILKHYSHGLKAVAHHFGLAYEVLEYPPARYMPRGFAPAVLGQEAAVKATAQKISKEAAKEQREAEAKRQAEEARRQAADKAKQQRLLDEAKRMPDWDITGTWSVECNAMADYNEWPDRRAELSVEIWRDDFGLEDVRKDEPESDEEDDDIYGYGFDIPASASRPAQAPPHRNDTRIPRYHASFNFALIEGTMRLYPPAPTTKPPFHLKSHPTLSYVYRCRETGEGEIQVETNTYDPERITFSEHGTRFTAMFRCPYISGLVEIKGTKTNHGGGEVRSSKVAWAELSERAWDRGHVTRWGRMW